jgi:hypothetical protein
MAASFASSPLIAVTQNTFSSQDEKHSDTVQVPTSLFQKALTLQPSSKADIKVSAIARELLLDYPNKGFAALSQELLKIGEEVRELDISSLGLPIKIIAQLAHYFPNLESLSLIGYQESDEVIVQLKNFSKLRTLDLSFSDVTGKTFTKLSPHIVKVILNNCKGLKESALSDLSHTALLHLDLGETGLKCSKIGKLPKSIKFLKLAHCNLEEKVISELNTFASLESLDIGWTKIQGNFFEKLPKSLKILECAHTGINDKAIIKLSNSTIEHLDISWTEVSGLTFDELPKTVKNLISAFCPTLADEAIQKLAKSTLEKLNICATKIEGKHFAFLPGTMKNLNCADCNMLGEVAIVGLKNSHIEYLNVSRSQITGEHFVTLPASLKTFKCQGCAHLTEKALQWLKNFSLHQNKA